jgi:uncharacterized protein DUF3991/Toprim domain-containing protein
MSVEDLRWRAAAVRDVPLETVLILRGAVRDRRDRSKWHTEQGPLSLSGSKFMNWRQGRGGGGAIDLVMHLADVDFRSAVTWLEHHVAGGPVIRNEKETLPLSSSRGPSAANGSHELRLPLRDDRRLDRVIEYLTGRRRLSAALVKSLLESGKLYADHRGNAVFLLLAGKAHRPVGAELRGTGPVVWRGMAPGTRKDCGYFWIGVQGAREIVLCESAIDTISCFQMHPQRICISTSGVRANPPWLHKLIARGYDIHCGFDADGPGDTAATQMLALHPRVKRLRPLAHDWNDALALSK